VNEKSSKTPCALICASDEIFTRRLVCVVIVLLRVLALVALEQWTCLK
jgi:hypothetical protein